MGGGESAAAAMMEKAERAFNQQNYSKAVEYANKAKEIDPNLPGIDNYIASYSVHLSATTNTFINLQSTIIDWYSVLGITISDDIGCSISSEIIKKSYKKLALLVHPDKNKSNSADSAFKLISNAWDILSNETQRKEFDLQRRKQYWKPRPPPPYPDRRRYSQPRTRKTPRKPPRKTREYSPYESSEYYNSPYEPSGGYHDFRREFKPCPKCDWSCPIFKKYGTNISWITCKKCQRNFYFRRGIHEYPPSPSSDEEEKAGILAGQRTVNHISIYGTSIYSMGLSA